MWDAAPRESVRFSPPPDVRSSGRQSPSAQFSAPTCSTWNMPPRRVAGASESIALPSEKRASQRPSGITRVAPIAPHPTSTGPDRSAARPDETQLRTAARPHRPRTGSLRAVVARTSGMQLAMIRHSASGGRRLAARDRRQPGLARSYKLTPRRVGYEGAPVSAASHVAQAEPGVEPIGASDGASATDDAAAAPSRSAGGRNGVSGTLTQRQTRHPMLSPARLIAPTSAVRPGPARRAGAPSPRHAHGMAASPLGPSFRKRLSSNGQGNFRDPEAACVRGSRAELRSLVAARSALSIYGWVSRGTLVLPFRSSTRLAPDFWRRGWKGGAREVPSDGAGEANPNAGPVRPGRCDRVEARPRAFTCGYAESRSLAFKPCFCGVCRAGARCAGLRIGRPEVLSPSTRCFRSTFRDWARRRNRLPSRAHRPGARTYNRQ